VGLKGVYPLDNQNVNTINVKQSIDLGDLIKELKKDNKPKRKYKKRQQDLTTPNIQDIIDQQDTPNQAPIIVRSGDSAPQIIQGSQGTTPQAPDDLRQKIPIPIEIPEEIPDEMVRELEKLYKDKTDILKNAEEKGITLPEEFVRSETVLPLPINPTPIQIRTLIDEIYRDNQQATDIIENLSGIIPQQTITTNITGTRPRQQSITTNITGSRPQQSITTNTSGIRPQQPSSISTSASMPDLLRMPPLSDSSDEFKSRFSKSRFPKSILPPSRFPKSILPPTPNDPEAPDISELDDENLSTKELRDKFRKIKAYYRKFNKTLPDMSKSPGYQKLRKDYEVEPSAIVKELREIRENQSESFKDELEKRMIKNPQTIEDELENTMYKLIKNEPYKPYEPMQPIKPRKGKTLTQRESLINSLRKLGRNPPRDTPIDKLKEEYDRILEQQTSPINDNLITRKEIEQQRKPSTIDTLFSNYGPPKSFLDDIRKSGSFGSNNTQSMNIPPQTSLLDTITQPPRPQRNLLGQALGGFSDFLSSSKSARDNAGYAGGALAIAQPELIPAIGIAETANQALNIIENPLTSLNRKIQESIDRPIYKTYRTDSSGQRYDKITNKPLP
jgi:hypothetical protein